MDMCTDNSYECKVGCGDFETTETNNNHDRNKDNNNIMLNLNLSSQKSDNIFTDTDQTPTPTRLIRNCEEVGLFDDLQHVNPFDETFRRAVEQNACQTPNTSKHAESSETHPEEDSLHTPQVFPQLETSDHIGGFGSSCDKPLECQSATSVTLDMPAVVDLLNAVNGDYKFPTSRQNSNNSTSSISSMLGFGKISKYRSIQEKPSVMQSSNSMALAALNNNCHTCIQLPGASSSSSTVAATSIQLIQPNVITWNLQSNRNDVVINKHNVHLTNAIPVQTVKPFLLPKLESRNDREVTTPLQTSTIATSSGSSATVSQFTNHEPSSASLTPTAQLPIKERLKAILNSSNHKSRNIEVAQQQKNHSHSRHIRGGAHAKSKQQQDDDCNERKRAAATRYRIKMRNEHKELRRRNNELQMENEKLHERIRYLEREFENQRNISIKGSNSSAQVQIAPSTIQLVMNIPTLLVPSNGQPILQNPITYMVQKK